MKTKILLSAIIIFCVGLFFTACQKNTSASMDETTQVSTEADDQSTVSNEADDATNDADAMVEASTSFSGRGYDIQSLICDATVVADTTGNTRTLTITYNGTNCLGNRTRTGVIVISMPQGIRWKNAGVAVTVTFQDFKVTRIRDSKSVTINGAITYTNVTGGLLLNLSSLGTITHTITSSGMTVTFDNNSQRTWQIAKQRTFTYNNGVVISTTGTHTDGSTTRIAIWGTNRFGNSFVWQITEPIVVRQDCSFRVTSGTVVNIRPNVTATATFGLDVTGNPVSCPSGTYYMKIVWVGAGGVTRTAILPY